MIFLSDLIKEFWASVDGTGTTVKEYRYYDDSIREIVTFTLIGYNMSAEMKVGGKALYCDDLKSLAVPNLQAREIVKNLQHFGEIRKLCRNAYQVSKPTFIFSIHPDYGIKKLKNAEQ